MNFTLKISNLQPKLILLLRRRRRLLKSNPSALLHCNHLSSETNPSPPPQDGESVAIQVVQHLLQTPENEWNINLLLSSSPRLLFQITRRLGLSNTALKFLQFIRTQSPSQDPQSVPSVFQAVLELASREPNSPDNLIQLYNTSKEQNIPLTINSATLLVRCFGRAGLIDESLLVYKELDPCLKNTHVRNVVIRVLLKSRRVDDALKMLDEMLEPNTESLPNDITADIVFSELLRRERLGSCVNEEKIIGLVSKFGEHGIFPSAVWLTQLITGLCRSRRVKDAWDIFHTVMESGGAVEIDSCNSLLSGLGREKDFEKMNALMAEMKKRDIRPNVVTFGILINHLCKLRKVDAALEVFENMKGGKENGGVSVEPDVITFNTLIDGLCKVGRQEEGLALMERMRSENGCAPSTATYNCLIDGFCKAGEIERAHQLFDRMNNEGVTPNVITLNTLVDGMCRHGRINSAVEFFNEMRSKGLKANAITYTSFITAFCNVNNISKAMEFFDEMFRAKCSPDAIVYYTLISGLSQAGRLDDASFVASKLKEAGFCMDTLCYNVLLGGFCKKNKLDKAYELLLEMEAAGVKPDSITYNTLISYLSKTGDFSTAHRVMRKMTNEELVPTVVTFGALIHAYCLNGNTEEAMKIFRDMCSASKVPPNTAIYNILIDSLCMNNEVEHALSLMDDMKNKGVRPNTNTFNAMFKGLREKNWLQKAFELMDRMVEQACNPDYITMEVLTEWLSAVGETGKLKNFVQGYEVSSSSA